MARTKSRGKKLPIQAFGTLVSGPFLQGKFDVSYDPSESVDKGMTYGMLVKLYRAGVNVCVTVKGEKGQPETVYDASTEQGQTVWIPRGQKIVETMPDNGTESRP